MSDTKAPTARTRVVREAHRGVYERAAAYEILDEGFICHVGFVVDGQPFVIPTGYGRTGDNLYIHGSAASRMLRNLDKGIPVCITVTLLDGLVLARSIFNHSMNYRSVMVLGTAVAVRGCEGEIRSTTTAFGAHFAGTLGGVALSPTKKNSSRLWCCVCLLRNSPPRCGKGRPSTTKKIYSFPTWAGVIPLETVAGAPINDVLLDPDTPVPDYARAYSRKK